MHAGGIVSTYNDIVDDPEFYLDEIERVEYAIRILEEIHSCMVMSKKVLTGKPITVENFCNEQHLLLTKSQVTKLVSMAKSICDKNKLNTYEIYNFKDGKKDSGIYYPGTVFPEYILFHAAKEFGLLPTRDKAA